MIAIVIKIYAVTLVHEKTFRDLGSGLECRVLCMVRVLIKWRKMKVLIIIMVACKENN